jgi:hypothetical protein
MSRLGTWRPDTVAARLDRMESLAHGVIYCRDELERPELGEWHIGVLQYWDRYRRVDGEWCFQRRRFHRCYMTDALARPAHGAGLGTPGLRTEQLPRGVRIVGSLLGRTGRSRRWNSALSRSDV